MAPRENDEGSVGPGFLIGPDPAWPNYQDEAKVLRHPADFRAWLESHQETAKELLVGFHKKGSGKPSITWPES